MSNETRGETITRRMSKIGLSKSEMAERAGMDRSTLGRALADDPKVGERTWTKIENALTDLEDELGMAESGALVTSVIEVNGARVTVKGDPEHVAQTVRAILAG